MLWNTFQACWIWTSSKFHSFLLEEQWNCFFPPQEVCCDTPCSSSGLRGSAARQGFVRTCRMDYPTLISKKKKAVLNLSLPIGERNVRKKLLLSTVGGTSVLYIMREGISSDWFIKTKFERKGKKIAEGRWGSGTEVINWTTVLTENVLVARRNRI